MKNDELDYKQITEMLVQGNLTVSQYFSIFTWINCVIQSRETEYEGRDILLRIMDKKDELPAEISPIVNDYLDRLGYFPYIEVDDAISTRTLLHYEFYRSENIPQIVMHQKQAEIFEAITNQQNIILSAPTSFGKSLLIEEIVASRKYDNIVIILPTLALIDETRNKLIKYIDFYKLIFSSKQSFGDKNVLILTPERFLELEKIPKIDFFIIDEFYKLDSVRNEDERLNVLNNAFYKLIKSTKNFYLLGPNIAAIPLGFESDFQCKFISSKFSTVACDEIFIERENKREKTQLCDLLKNLNEPTMIYCKSPGSAERNVKDFLKKAEDFLKKINTHKDAINWIKNNIHPKWLLNEALSYGVAFHHGSMPRHLGRYIVEEFNRGTIKYLFCTSTLIEGINTTAKNVIIFEDMKGKTPITYFDYSNIRGRAGRMKQHFLGRVYSFYNPPKNDDVNIDIPWYTQDKASDEILIQVEDEDLKQFSKEKIKPYKEQQILEIDIIRKNNNIPVKGQIELAEIIQNDLKFYHKRLCWTNFPTYEQLETTCILIYDYLKYKNTRDEIFTGKQLAYYVNNYVRMKSNMVRFISFLFSNGNDVKTVDKAVQKATKINRSWFEFRFPKLLLGLQEIQEAIFKQNNLHCGDYKFYASLIESAFCDPALSSLQEFGLPISLLRHLEQYLDLNKFKDDENLDSIVDQIKLLDINELELDPFERKLLKDFIKVKQN